MIVIHLMGIGLLPLAQLLIETFGTFIRLDRLEALSMLFKYSLSFIVRIY